MSGKAEQTQIALLGGLITGRIHGRIHHSLLFVSCLPYMEARGSEFYRKTKGLSAFICEFFHSYQQQLHQANSQYTYLEPE